MRKNKNRSKRLVQLCSLLVVFIILGSSTNAFGYLDFFDAQAVELKESCEKEKEFSDLDNFVEQDNKLSSLISLEIQMEGNQAVHMNPFHFEIVTPPPEYM